MLTGCAATGYDYNSALWTFKEDPMRSGLAATLMGIGGILLSFGAVIVVLALFARYGDTRGQLPGMTSTAVGSIVVGAVMFGAGYLLGRVGRNSDRSLDSSRTD
jgi:hypothetical protein